MRLQEIGRLFDQCEVKAPHLLDHLAPNHGLCSSEVEAERGGAVETDAGTGTATETGTVISISAVGADKVTFGDSEITAGVSCVNFSARKIRLEE